MRCAFLLQDTEKSAVGYQPFPPTHMSDTDDAPAQVTQGYFFIAHILGLVIRNSFTIAIVSQ